MEFKANLPGVVSYNQSLSSRLRSQKLRGLANSFICLFEDELIELTDCCVRILRIWVRVSNWVVVTDLDRLCLRVIHLKFAMNDISSIGRLVA